MKESASLALTLVVAASALAQDMKDPREILRKADAATKNVQAAQYEAQYEGLGGVKDAAMQVSGKAMLQKIDADNNQYRILIRAQARKPGSERTVAVEIGTDGQTWFAIWPSEKKVSKGEGGWAFGGATVAGALMMPEYVRAAPFVDEINADKAELQGVEAIAGERCYKIQVEYAEGSSPSIWYFSTSDFLPRRLDRLGKNASGETVGTSLTLRDLAINPEISETTFALNVPEGFDVETVAKPAPPELLPIGSQAPDWTLQTPDGQSVSLSQFKGSVVLMDFWATWCPPCRAAMPHLQRLHEDYASKGVKVLGLNCREQNGDPVKFMKDKNYTYGLLLNADDVYVTYKGQGIPMFYVIGGNGKIAYAKAGFDGTEEEVKEIEAAIQKALENTEG